MKSLILLLCLLPLFAIADEGDELKVRVNIVNLRADAAENAEVVLKLGKGRRVTEVQRQGRWVLVDTGREDIPNGWVSQGFLEKYEVIEGVETLFDLFELAFDEYHQSLRVNTDMVYFSGVNDLGGGDLQVVTTPSWLYRLEAGRNEDMVAIFAMWEAIVGLDQSRSVTMVDEEQSLLMFMMK